MNEHEKDLCYCGDYRRDHVDGVGRCTMKDDLTHGFEPCRQFRLAWAHGTPEWKRAMGDAQIEAKVYKFLKHEGYVL